ncbi:hypothetical protein GCM10012287_12250 [Streptomyces daqingensis]|uniref:Uncharacterized protein n=1 Tax=Streptomyces daqingensis TaxID=1472640 RepID=A0ABQ2M017_9ACTN|nr:hypothetical protein GCM10012287_12250 [Streptomyces daqingensis]
MREADEIEHEPCLADQFEDVEHVGREQGVEGGTVGQHEHHGADEQAHEDLPDDFGLAEPPGSGPSREGKEQHDAERGGHVHGKGQVLP